jgi:hypothetical protein
MTTPARKSLEIMLLKGLLNTYERQITKQTVNLAH